MGLLPLRAQRYFVSLVGALFFLPVYLFWGGVFSFSFTATDSFWAWGFGLVACWAQILAIMASFFYPRKAAYWLILNTVISMFLAFGYVTQSANGHPPEPNHVELWLQSGTGIFRTAMIFWAPPLLIAVLLLRRSYNRKKALVKPAAAAMSTPKH